MTTDQLTTTETQRLGALESTIEKGLQTFVEVGSALAEIRDSRLYRSTFATFGEYCQQRWRMARQTAYQYIVAAEVVENVRHGGHSEALPTNERQARPLTSLAPSQQVEAWSLVVETVPDGEITAAHVQAVVKNYKRDNKANRQGDIYTPQGYDACQTPAYAIDPLLSYLPRNWTVWEPAAGEGNLVEALFDGGFSQVVATDLLRGENFFEFEPEVWDCIVTNPPYSIKYDWLKRCYELDQPFALLMPVEMLGAKTAQDLFDQYGIEVILLDQRVNFKMPFKGWDSSAQFPVCWYTYGLNIGQQLTFGKITKGDS